MSLVELLAHPVSRQLTLALAHFLWQGLAVAMILVLVVEWLGVRRPAARYTCSLAALLLMVLCPVATIVWVGQDDSALRASGFTPEAYNPQSFDEEQVGAVADPASSRWPLTTWVAVAQPYALAAWLIGVTIFAGRLSAGAIGILRLRQKLIPLPLDLASSVERLGRRLGVEALPLVFLSRRVTEAMAVGVVRPLVLIPAVWATEMPLEMLEAVIAHELAHLRRRDLWVNLLQRVVETVLFYHPAVWWLSHRLRQERELCADELAVAATGCRLEYAQTLEQVARRRQADVGPALAAFIRGGKNMRLLERVQNVLGLAAGTDRARLWPVGLLILALPLVLWMVSLGLSAAVADDDREDGDRPRATREAEDDDDGDRREGRRENDDDDGDDDDEGDDDDDEGDDDDDGDDDEDEGDDDEKEGKGNDDKDERNGKGDNDKDERDGKGDADKDEKDDDGDKEDKKFFGKEEREEGQKEGRKDGDVKKEGPRDGDAPKKEGARDGDAPKKEGPRDGGFKKEGVRDGDVKKEGPRDGDAPKKEGARDGDAPRKEVRKDEPRKEGDKPIKKEGVREVEKKVVKEGAGNDDAIYQLKSLVSKLMAENEKLRAELAAARGGKDYGVKKEGGDKEAAIKREGGDKEALIRKEREAGERKKPAGREGDEKALIEKKRAAVEKAEAAEEKEESAARERLRREIDKKEGDRKEGDRKEGDQPE